MGAEAPHRKRTNNVGKQSAYDIVDSMNKLLKSSHVVYRCEYHFVWVPKYRYKVLIGEVKERLKEILRELCEWQEITILEGAIKDRSCSHVFFGTPEAFSVSRDEDTEGKKRRIFGEGISRTGKEILGNAYLGEGVLCKYSRDERRNNQGICKKAAGRNQEDQRRLWKDNSE